MRTARVEHHIEAPSRRSRSANVAWLIIVVALFLILPMLQVLLKREIGSSVSDPVPEFTEEQAIEADSNAYDDLRPLVSAGGTDWDGDLPAGLYVVGQDLPAGTYTIKCAEDGTSMEMHLVNDACGVEIYEDLSAYDAADSGLDDVPLPAGTVLFLTGNNALYFHSSNAQVDDLSTDTAPNPVTDDISYTLSDSEDSLYLLVGEDIEPGVYDVTCTAGSGYFAFDLPMENTRTMYCSAWLYGDPDYVDTLRHITLTEDTDAVAGADAVYTDVWVSMGEPTAVWEERINALAPYQVNAALMAKAKRTAVFMHCLPAYHDHKTAIGREMGERFGRAEMEVTDEVFTSRQSIVFQEAENRMHTIKAVMAATLGA